LQSPRSWLLTVMIDIHSHILYDVDDGPRTIEESIEMCRLSAQDGVTVMVATPHAHDYVHTTHDPRDLMLKVNELNSALGGRPRIELGCELRFTHEVVAHVCVDKSAPTLAGGPYVLVEFPHLAVPVGAERVFYELLNNGIRPIIAHPERNRVLMGEPERFFAMVEMGLLGQLDTGSVTGQFGKTVQRAAANMLEHGLIHLMASDCHNTRNRLPGLSSAVTEVSAIIGEEGAQKISTDNPRAVVEGNAIPWIPAPAPPTKKRRKWLFF
jgi:protein-tyrosine phosphatase